MARTSRTGTRTDLALLGVAVLLSVVALILPTTVRGTLQGSLRSGVAAPLVAAQAWAERGRQAIGDHGRLVNIVDSLSLAAQSTVPLRAENERLRALIGLGQRLQWGFVATEIVHPGRGADENTVLLAAGASAGVRPFSPVVVPDGLIGMVTSVDASSSTAILWTNPDFRASATTTDGLAFGIVAAHLGNGADRYLLEMRGVPFRSELKPGTLIVSSGLGNVFPRGIPIGIVLRETKTVEGWARTYLLRPIVPPDATGEAIILLPPRAAVGVTTAWSSAAAADSSQKRITMAGDSMVADSLRLISMRADALARLDSLRRAAIYGGDSGVRVEGDSTTQPAGARVSDSVRPRPPVASPPVSATTPQGSPAVAPSVRMTAPVIRPSARRARPDSARLIQPPARRARPDSAPVIQPPSRRARPDSAATRLRPDSARARNRSRPVKKAPSPPTESPFRLPPAGASE